MPLSCPPYPASAKGRSRFRYLLPRRAGRGEASLVDEARLLVEGPDLAARDVRNRPRQNAILECLGINFS